MLKLHVYARAAVTLGASLLIAGSASAETSGSSSEFVDFFESMFDNDSNGGRRAAANTSANALEEIAQSVSVLGIPQEGEETEFGEPEWAANEEDGRRVTLDGDGGGGIEIEVLELIEAIDRSELEDLGECDPLIRRCGGSGGGGGGANPVPEPSAGVLFGLGALLIQRRLRR